jgi:hypothetical protein
VPFLISTDQTLTRSKGQKLLDLLKQRDEEMKKNEEEKHAYEQNKHHDIQHDAPTQ